MSEYFPKPKSLSANVKAELDFSNYATKTDLKIATGVDTLDFAKKSDLANLKSDVDKRLLSFFRPLPSPLVRTLLCLIEQGGLNCKFWENKPSSSFNYYK